MTDETTSAPVAPAPKPTVKIAVKKIIDGAQARKDSTVSLADLSTAMQDQASLRIHYGELSAEATRQVNDLKIKLEAAESAVYRTVRDELTTAGVKITEDLLKREVAAHRTILAIKLAINEAKQIEGVAKAVFEAFGDRKDMLVQLGAKDRAELSGELRLAIAGANQDAIKQGASDMMAKRQALLDRNGAAA